MFGNANLSDSNSTDRGRRYFSYGSPKTSRNKEPIVVDSVIFPAPCGAFNLALYDYRPPTRSPTSKIASVTPSNEDIATEFKDPNSMQQNNHGEGETLEKPKNIKKKRKSKNLEKIIRILEDKRILEDADACQLEDIKMPRLRNALNIMFVTFGVCFLLAVLIVIIYTTIISSNTTSP